MNSSQEEAMTEVAKERSRRTTPPVYAPSLVITHGKNYQNQTFCIPSDQSYHVRSVPEMRGMFSMSSSYGWLMLLGRFSDDCHLFNPITLTKIQLPPTRHDSYDIAVLTSPPSDPKCVIVLFSEDEKLCFFCRIGDEKWTEQAVRAKNSDILVEKYRSAVCSRGKIYLLFAQRMAVIDVEDNFACIELSEIEYPKGFAPYGTTFDRNILESSGEIFLVYKIMLGGTGIVQNFVVFNLDNSKMVWVKMDSLGDRIFLLGAYSVGLSASEFGVKGNCVYYFSTERIELYCFDMEDGTTTVTQPCPIKFPQWGRPFWMVPNCKVQMKKEMTKATEIQVSSNILPTELFHMISQSLCLSDGIRFRIACKGCISMTSPVRSFPLQTITKSQHLPWLLSLPNTEKNTCNFYHPIYTDACFMTLPQLQGAIVRHAKFGWLLMSRGGLSIFFFNPITLETIQLPDRRELISISFSAPPTSSNCVVLALHFCDLDYVRLSLYSSTKNRWSVHFLRDLPYTFVPSHCNPVFHDDVFYCLGKDGKLGIFDPRAKSEEDMWRVYAYLSVPDVNVPQPDILVVPIRSFLTECEGEIFSVFVGVPGNPIRIYKLDGSKKKMKWLKVSSLGSRVMFVSHTTSLLMPASLKGTEDRIYLPRFKGSSSVFYSLRSGKYHCFGQQDSRVDWMDTCEHCNCTWFQITC